MNSSEFLPRQLDIRAAHRHLTDRVAYAIHAGVTEATFTSSIVETSGVARRPAKIWSYDLPDGGESDGGARLP